MDDHAEQSRRAQKAATFPTRVIPWGMQRAGKAVTMGYFRLLTRQNDSYAQGWEWTVRHIPPEIPRAGNGGPVPLGPNLAPVELCVSHRAQD